MLADQTLLVISEDLVQAMKKIEKLRREMSKCDPEADEFYFLARGIGIAEIEILDLRMLKDFYKLLSIKIQELSASDVLEKELIEKLLGIIKNSVITQYGLPLSDKNYYYKGIVPLLLIIKNAHLENFKISKSQMFAEIDLMLSNIIASRSAAKLAKANNLATIFLADEINEVKINPPPRMRRSILSNLSIPKSTNNMVQFLDTDARPVLSGDLPATTAELSDVGWSASSVTGIASSSAFFTPPSPSRSAEAVREPISMNPVLDLPVAAEVPGASQLTLSKTTEQL